MFSRKIPVSLNAKIVSGGKTYAGLIENVSEYGMISMIQISKDFTPEKIIELNFQIPSGEILSLNCELIWFLRMPLCNKELTLGFEIINPPQKYKEFIITLNFSNN